MGLWPTAPQGAEAGILESQGQGNNRIKESESSLDLGTTKKLMLDLVPEGMFFCNPQFLSPFSVRFKAG